MIPPEPYTRYRLWLRAYTVKHEGKPSPEVQVDIGFDLCFLSISVWISFYISMAKGVDRCESTRAAKDPVVDLPVRQHALRQVGPAFRVPQVFVNNVDSTSSSTSSQSSRPSVSCRLSLSPFKTSRSLYMKCIWHFRTVDVYYVYYRSRRPGDGDTEWEEQVVETVNNTINHMVGRFILMVMLIVWDEIL